MTIFDERITTLKAYRYTYIPTGTQRWLGNNINKFQSTRRVIKLFHHTHICVYIYDRQNGTDIIWLHWIDIFEWVYGENIQSNFRPEIHYIICSKNIPQIGKYFVKISVLVRARKRFSNFPADSARNHTIELRNSSTTTLLRCILYTKLQLIRRYLRTLLKWIFFEQFILTCDLESIMVFIIPFQNVSMSLIFLSRHITLLFKMSFSINYCWFSF